MISVHNELLLGKKLLQGYDGTFFLKKLPLDSIYQYPPKKKDLHIHNNSHIHHKFY